MKPSRFNRFAALVTVAVSLAATASSFAATGTWLTTNGNWSDSAMWSGATVADGATFTAKN